MSYTRTTEDAVVKNTFTTRRVQLNSSYYGLSLSTNTLYLYILLMELLISNNFIRSSHLDDDVVKATYC